MEQRPGVAVGRRVAAPEALCAFVAWALPFGLALVRTSPHAQWRGDAAQLRDLGLSAVGWGGGVSTTLTQITRLAPLGTLTFRGALVAALALAVTGAALHAIALHLLRALERGANRQPSRWAGPALATLASLVATLSPQFQSEATAMGSTMVAAALSTWVLALGLDLVAGDRGARPHARILLGGFVLGATVAENSVAGATAFLGGLSLLCVLRYSGGDRRLLVPFRVMARAGFAAGLGVAVFSLPAILRWVAPGAPLDLGDPWIAGSTLPPDLASRPGLAEAWAAEIGWVPLALAVFGGAVLALRGSSRPLVAAVLVWPIADLALRAALGPTEGTLATRVLALGAIACTSTAGLYACVTELARFKFPFVRAGAAMLVAFYGTLVALIAESASEQAARNAKGGALELTDAALDSLPPSAAIVLDSRIVAFRLLAAQIVEGRRADVLIVPRKLIDRGNIAAVLVAREPAVEPLVRTVALGHASDEFAFSHLADRRPLMVELERGWSDRIYPHLTIDGAWLRFRAEPLGTSDRKGDLEKNLAPLRRLLETLRGSGTDPVTLHVVGWLARSHARVLLRLGEPELAIAHLAQAQAPGTSVLAHDASLDVLFASAVARLPQQRAAARAKATEAAPRRR